MARTIKIDNALQKKFTKKKEVNSRELVTYFLIVCEGEKTEPNYFKSFPKKVGKVVFDVEFDGGGINTLKVVEKAIELRECSKQKYDRVWAVFDRDSFKASQFNSAILKAKANDIRCAWSNEAFELWYVLHFYNRVTPMSRDEYKKVIEKAVNLMAKKGKKFLYEKNSPEMFSIMAKYGNINSAIQRAKDLSRENEGNSFANFNPQTMVFELVEELLGKSQELNDEIMAKYSRGE